MKFRCLICKTIFNKLGKQLYCGSICRKVAKEEQYKDWAIKNKEYLKLYRKAYDRKRYLK